MNKSLTTVGTKKLAIVDDNVPALADDFASELQGFGTGFENLRQEDVIIPRLTIIQGLSPQIIPNKPEYDPNARVGNIYDVGLGQSFDSVEFLPCHFSVAYLEWAPRERGGGLVSISEKKPDASTYSVNDRNQMVKNNGNIISETAQIYGLNLSAGGRPSFIPFSSTQLKRSRKWMTLATGERIEVNGVLQTPPLFYRSYTLSSVPESNAKGNWMAWDIKPSLRIDQIPDGKSRLATIRAFRQQITSGEVRGDIEHEQDHTNHSSDGAM